MSRRDETRQATIAAIKRLALEQLREAGAGRISLNEIARGLGMTGPGLFRYVQSRNDLMTELVVDAYLDLGDALWETVTETADQPVAERLRAHAAAYRNWALANPHRYALLFGSPVPGYVAPADRTQPVAIRALASTFAIAAGQPGVDADPTGDPLAAALRDWATEHNLPPLTFGWLRQGILGWTRLHGVLSLELEGHFRFGLPDPAVIYDSEVEELIWLVEQEEKR